MEDSLSGPLLVLAICVGIAAAVYKSKQYEDAKFLRYMKEHECRVVKHNRKTGEATFRCNDGKEFVK